MLRTSLALMLLVVTARADVLILDPHGGGDFSTVQQVTDAAHDGDIILVRPGDYSGSSSVTFGNKSLTIIADGTGVVDFPRISIAGIGVGQTFVLRGVRMQSAGPVAQLQVYGSDGSVIVEDCTIVGTGVNGGIVQGAAVKVNVANLTLESCTILGGIGPQFFFGPGGQLGGVGLFALAAHISVNNCTLRGGEGASELESDDVKGGAAGGAAVLITQTELFLAGCEVEGGAGGADTGVPVASGAAAGGTGLHADATSLVHLRDTTVAGGAGGTDAAGTGPAGIAFDLPPAALHALDGAARTLHVSAPLDEGQAGDLDITGAPGDLVAVLVSLQGAWKPIAPFGGVALVGPGAAGPFVFGTLDASGALHLDVVGPHLGLGPAAGLVLVTQLVVSTGSSIVLGDASALVLLGS